MKTLPVVIASKEINAVLVLASGQFFLVRVLVKRVILKGSYALILL